MAAIRAMKHLPLRSTAREAQVVTISEALCKAILSVRTEMGVSQRQLAARIALKSPMPRSYISKIENGRAVPGIENIQAIAVALGITAHELIAIAEGLMGKELPSPEKKPHFYPNTPKKFKRAEEVTMVRDPDAIKRRRELAKKLGTLRDEVTQ
jgi:transcriptional regulator with XRE-family HTH domain